MHRFLSVPQARRPWCGGDHIQFGLEGGPSPEGGGWETQQRCRYCGEKCLTSAFIFPPINSNLLCRASVPLFWQWEKLNTCLCGWQPLYQMYYKNTSLSVWVWPAGKLWASNASGLGPNRSGWGPQHQEPQSPDLHGCLSAEGSCPLGCYRHPHSEQPAGHVLAAQVRQKHFEHNSFRDVAW